MDVDQSLIPRWVHRAARRRSLLALGLSLADVAALPVREADELLAVDAVFVRVQNEQNEKAGRSD